MKIKKKFLTFLSYGGGQDSTAILVKIIKDPEFRAKYVGDDHFIVVMSDTGDEHPHTYKTIKECQTLCSDNDIPFFFLQTKDGYHTEAWPNVLAPQLRKVGGKFKPTMVQLGTLSCTHKLKLGPIYKFIDEYINEWQEYGHKVQKSRGCLKKAIKQYHKECGKIRVLIGFAFKEERRMEKARKIEVRDHARVKTWQSALVREFPLIEEKMDREACSAYLADHGMRVLPSNCMLCPYQSPIELLWLERNHPDKWAMWVEIEDNKIQRNIGHEKNYGAYAGKKLLPQKLEEAKLKFGHLSNEEIDQNKFTHGCATAF